MGLLFPPWDLHLNTSFGFYNGQFMGNFSLLKSSRASEMRAAEAFIDSRYATGECKVRFKLNKDLFVSLLGLREHVSASRGSAGLINTAGKLPPIKSDASLNSLCNNTVE
ncbi:hypothetical protein AVEN_106446-1 [Araneus ventricosus]|uniref:Uncharacterized protein n=1 Tax=Araneus ventricosus TaxID=182803 RepID=A0A4Y2AV12_ARAVE|nr:hypothetical protein AVEN_106446-1 [Araneus ventricosus]